MPNNLVRNFLNFVVIMCYAQVAACQDTPNEMNTPQVSKAIPTGWQEYPMPPKGHKDWMRANYSKKEWRVFSEYGNIRIERVYGPSSEEISIAEKQPCVMLTLGDCSISISGSHEDWLKDWESSGADQLRFPKSIDPSTVHVADGWLQGFDVGEFGGGLFWFSPDLKRHYRINSIPAVNSKRGFDFVDNVHGITTHQDSLIVFQGLSHGGIDDGLVTKVNFDTHSNKWVASLFALLPGAPRAFFADSPGEWVIMTTQDLVSLDSKGQVKVICHLPETKSLYANSIAKAKNGDIYIGMRQFVFLVQRVGKNCYHKLLTPIDEPVFEQSSVN